MADGWGLHAYDYDPTYQLTEADYPQGFSFEDLAEIVYDAVYNREEMTSGQTTISYVANPLHQYASVDAVAYTYDDNGNLTYDGNQKYVYDAENRLVEVLTPSDVLVASYTYDSFGRRLSKTVAAAGVTTTYVYSGPHVIAEYEDPGSGGDLARMYVYGPGLDEPIMMLDVAGQSRYFYACDGLGSVTALSNMNGQIVERYAYDAFGQTQILDAGLSVLSASQYGNPIMFTGRRLDVESGLYDYRARIYSPALGRFLQTDPLGYIDGMNLYAYVNNNPLNWIDPWGLWGDGNEKNIHDGTWTPNTLPGHSDFGNGWRMGFDYTKEDRGWGRPENPASTWRHFRERQAIQRDLLDAVRDGDKERFERLMHRGQDTFSHYDQGYRWYKGGHAWDSIRGRNPDNPYDEDGNLNERFRAADDFTRNWERRWKEAREREQKGKESGG